MKRKIIQLAGKTFVLSLPIKWAKKYGIEKGDEIDVIEDGQRLIISTAKLLNEKKKEVDVKVLHEMVNRVMGALYKAGYDEIEIQYKTTHQFSEIRKCLNRTCIGMEIVEHGNNRLLIRDISSPNPEELNNIFRRYFLSLLSVAEDSLEFIKNKNKEGLKEILMRDDTINRYADFCRRVINKMGTDLSKRSPPLYHIAEQLERMGDVFNDFVTYILEANSYPDANLQKVHNEFNDNLRQYYMLFYSFDFEKLEQFCIKSKKIRKDIEKIIQQANKSQSMHAFYVSKLVNNLWELNGALITAKL